MIYYFLLRSDLEQKIQIDYKIKTFVVSRQTAYYLQNRTFDRDFRVNKHRIQIENTAS